MYNKLTLEIVEKALEESGIEDIGYVGDDLYYIGHGTYTNKQGYLDFIDSLNKWNNGTI